MKLLKREEENGKKTMPKILSINISNVCVDVAEDFELNDQNLNQVVKQIKEMFSDSATLKDHITTAYDDDNDILYHVQDGRITHNQAGGAEILEDQEIVLDSRIGN